eukprot:6114183-Prymnesium_polylepis.1
MEQSITELVPIYPRTILDVKQIVHGMSHREDGIVAKAVEKRLSLRIIVGTSSGCLSVTIVILLPEVRALARCLRAAPTVLNIAHHGQLGSACTVCIITSGALSGARQ